MRTRKVIVPIGPSIAYVPLTRGQFALIDSSDTERIGAFNWKAYWNPCTRSFYANRSVYRPGKNNETIMLHRLLLGAEPGLDTDHINGNGLDNRRSANLRLATKSQNNQNRRMLRTNISGFKGVSPSGRKYVAKIKANQEIIYLGIHATAEAAHAAYCEASARYHGNYGRTR